MYYLAVDIGASSGRVMLGSLKNGKITTEEIHRFSNGAVPRGGHLCWEVDRLFAEIKIGMRKCADMGIQPRSMAVDCFGVDFALLDDKGNIVGDTVSYRDSRTEGISKKAPLSLYEMYKRTGMEDGEISSVYQLFYLKSETDQLEKASRFLHLPDYLNYLLTGIAENEYSISQTAMLVNTHTGTYDTEILKELGIPEKLFKKPVPAGTVLGRVKPEIAAETGIDCDVVLAAGHDTVSAAAAVPCSDDCIFISSGTWSMIGTYISDMILCEEDELFCNMLIDKGHYGFIRGITGLYMITAIKRELNDKYTYDELCELAQGSDYQEIIDIDDGVFSAPESMYEAVRSYALGKGLKPVETLGDAIRCIYRSLAMKYAQNVELIEKLTKKQYDSIYIVGGGSRDWYLNQLTAEFTGKKIFAGPTEATAIGNIAAQLTAAGVFETLWDAKTAVEDPKQV